MSSMDAVSQNRLASKKAISGIVISAMMLATAIVIKFIVKYIPMANWPNGGSISLVLVPLVLATLYCGAGWGAFVGISYSLIDFLLDGVVSWSSNPWIVLLTFILDYFLAFGSVAIVAIFRKKFYEKVIWVPSVSVLLYGVIRFFCHFLSGILVWNSNADYEHLIPDLTWGGFVYSISYNSSYMIPTIVICMIVITLILNALYTTFKLPIVSPLIPTNLQSDNSSLKIPSFHKSAVYLLLGLIAFATLTTIPALKMSGFGVIPLLFGLGVLAYEIYYLVKYDLKKNDEQTNKRIILDVVCLVLCNIVIAVSLAGIISQFTYAA